MEVTHPHVAHLLASAAMADVEARVLAYRQLPVVVHSGRQRRPLPAFWRAVARPRLAAG